MLIPIQAHIYIYRDLLDLIMTLEKHKIRYNYINDYCGNYIYLRLSEKDLTCLMYYLEQDGNITNYLREQLQYAGNNIYGWC